MFGRFRLGGFRSILDETGWISLDSYILVALHSCMPKTACTPRCLRKRKRWARPVQVSKPNRDPQEINMTIQIDIVKFLGGPYDPCIQKRTGSTQGKNTYTDSNIHIHLHIYIYIYIFFITYNLWYIDIYILHPMSTKSSEKWLALGCLIPHTCMHACSSTETLEWIWIKHIY